LSISLFVSIVELFIDNKGSFYVKWKQDFFYTFDSINLNADVKKGLSIFCHS